MLYPGPLHPEPLPLEQSTADLYTSKGDTQTQFWLSLCGVSGSWCAFISRTTFKVESALVAHRLKSLLQCGRPGFDPWAQKIPWRRKWQPIPVFLPGESHGQRSLVGYSPRGRKDSDTAERLPLHFHLESMKTKSFIELLNFENTLQISI